MEAGTCQPLPSLMAFPEHGRVCHLHKRITHNRALQIPVTLVLKDGTRHTLTALVDTGAEYNLCHPGHMPTSLWEESPNPLVLLAANESVVTGGNLELPATVGAQGGAGSEG